MSKVKGIKQTLASFKKISKEVLGKISDDVMFDLGAKVLELSEPEVPHDEGTLLGSGSTEKIGTKFFVGYNTEYAARLHYHPEYNFQDNRKAYYLTDPVSNNGNELVTFAKDRFTIRINKIL